MKAQTVLVPLNIVRSSVSVSYAEKKKFFFHITGLLNLKIAVMRSWVFSFLFKCLQFLQNFSSNMAPLDVFLDLVSVNSLLITRPRMENNPLATI